MEDLLQRVKTILGGHRENTAGDNTAPLLDTMSSIVHNAARSAGIGAACLVSVAVLTSNAQAQSTLFNGGLLGNMFGNGNQYNSQGYQPNQYNSQGYQPNQYNSQGYQPNQYNSQGYQPNQYNSQGYQPNQYRPVQPSRGGLDPSDIPYARAAAQAAETSQVGERFTWFNQQNGNSGYYAAVELGHLPNGAECRRIETEVTLRNQAPSLARTLNCRDMHTGAWRKMSMLETETAQFAEIEPQANETDVPAPSMG